MVAFLLWLHSVSALADDPVSIEIPVERVFFAEKGYGESDDVQAIIEGELPDPCYELSARSITRDAAGVLTIHQYGWRERTAICQTGDLLGERPFSEQISLGHFRAGDYRIASGDGFRELHVDRVGQGATIGFPQVSGLEVPDLVLEGSEIRIRFIGEIAFSCPGVSDPVAVSQSGDTFVLQAIEVGAARCAPIPELFDRSIALGVLPPGEYLVHVWTQAGEAVERTFRVLRRSR